ncbi:MAG: sigma-54 dependent transcriptional regulator [Myxococcota bacterium]
MNREKAKILVIDDEQPVCISCKRILEEEAHTVDYELSGIEGAKKAVRGNFDIVLLDLKMPDITGVEALEQIKKERPEMMVIIITGYATIPTSIECIKKGAFDYIPKPFTPEELAIAVEKALEHRRLKEENKFLKNGLSKVGAAANIIGRSEAIEEINKQILKVAFSEFNVMIYGESGTGKELVAQAIHKNSARKDKQFIAVDLSALTPTLIESELFGHVKGAFTGASQSRPGYFALAHGGTLFLDEISNISLHLQGKLLRVLETRKLTPVGGDREQNIDIRLITATNRDLAKLIEKGAFREDLYYRINVIPITIPPLRERPEDIPLLANHFLAAAQENIPNANKYFSREAMDKLIAYRWSGNVRELKNIVERLVATVEDEIIEPRHLPPEISEMNSVFSDIKLDIPKNAEELKKAKRQVKDIVYSQIELQFIINSLEAAGWNISRAAANTGLQRPNFHALMRKYGIKVRDTE